MGDARYAPHYARIRHAADPVGEIRKLSDDEVVSALAAASRGNDPYLANVLATEAHNRMHRASAVTTHLAEGVFALDAEGRVTFMNPAAEEMLGWTKAELLGRDLHEMIHRTGGGEAEARETCPLIRDVLNGGQTIHGEDLTYARKDGTTFPVSIASSPVMHEDQVEAVVVVFHDITSRVRAERRRAAHLAVTEALAEAPSLRAAAPRIFRAIGENLDWVVGQLWLLEVDTSLMRCAETWSVGGGAFDRFNEESRAIPFPRTMSHPGQVWDTREATHIRDVAKDPTFIRREVARRAGLHAAFAFPVIVNGEVSGVFQFLARDTRAEDPEVMAMGKGLGHQIGLYVERRAQEEGRHRLAEIVDASEDAIIGFDARGLITSWNRGAERMLGIDAASALGRPFLGLAPVDRYLEEQEVIAAVLRGERVSHFDTFRLARDGRRVRISLSAFPLRDSAGLVSGAAIIRDVTEQVRVLEALRESEARFRLLAENALDVIFHYRLAAPRRFDYVSPGAEAVTGYKPAAFYEDPDLLIRITHADDRWVVLRAIGGPGGRERPLVVRTLRKDGRLIWTETRFVPVQDAEGNTVAIEGIMRDVTAIKKAEERFRTLLESAPDAMIIVDAEGKMRLVNARAETLFGYTREELLGQTVELLVPGRYRPAHVQHRAHYGEFPHPRPMGAGLELYGRRKDGTEFPVEISLAPMETDEGRWVTAAIRDVEERERAEVEGRHLRGLGQEVETR